MVSLDFLNYGPRGTTTIPVLREIASICIKLETLPSVLHEYLADPKMVPAGPI